MITRQGARRKIAVLDASRAVGEGFERLQNAPGQADGGDGGNDEGDEDQDGEDDEINARQPVVLAFRPGIKIEDDAEGDVSAEKDHQAGNHRH
ncbi:hypothetical protein D3C72_1429380 [compost metagenome]